MKLRTAAWAWLVFLLSACRGQHEEDEQWRVEIGVFFGGQVQQLERIEYPKLDPPHVGFRLSIPALPKPATGPQIVRFELVVPGPAGRRITKTSQLQVMSGPRKVDQLFDVPEQARHGVWNVRIEHGETILADRALHVVAP